MSLGVVGALATIMLGALCSGATLVWLVAHMRPPDSTLLKGASASAIGAVGCTSLLRGVAKWYCPVDGSKIPAPPRGVGGVPLCEAPGVAEACKAGGPAAALPPRFCGQRAAKWSSELQSLHFMIWPSRPRGLPWRPNPFPLVCWRCFPFPFM